MTQFQSTSLPLPALPTGIVRSKGTCMCKYLISTTSMRSIFFFSGFKETTAAIYMQSTLRRPPSQPPAQTTFFFLDENLDVSRGSIHLPRLSLLRGYISKKCFINCFFYPTSILSFFEMKVRFWSWARFLDSVEQKLFNLRRLLNSSNINRA